jgi:hypothetical protein
MAAAQFGIQNVAAVGGSHPANFVGGNTHPMSGRADENTPLDLPAADRFGHRNSIVGEIDACGRIGPQIDHFMT